MTKATLEAAYAECTALVQSRDKDRFLASLFAPESSRPYLMALYAFNQEIARVRDTVSNPLPGEMRLQWWRDALAGIGHGGTGGAGHPIATALLDTAQACRLPIEALYNLIDARTFDLYDDPMPTVKDLEGYAGETSSALIQLAGIILAGGRDPGTAEVAGHAGVAYAVTGLLRALPFHAARGQVYLPGDILARHGLVSDDVLTGQTSPSLEAAVNDMIVLAHRHLQSTRRLVGRVSRELTPAFLPVSLVEPYLDRMQKPGRNPFGSPVEIPQWRRQLILWRAARTAARKAPALASLIRAETA